MSVWSFPYNTYNFYTKELHDNLWRGADFPEEVFVEGYKNPSISNIVLYETERDLYYCRFFGASIVRNQYDLPSKYKITNCPYEDYIEALYSPKSTPLRECSIKTEDLHKHVRTLLSNPSLVKKPEPEFFNKSKVKLDITILSVDKTSHCLIALPRM